VRNTDDKAHLYVVFATLLSPNTSKAKIFSSEPYYRTASVHNPPPIFKAKSHTHTKQQAKLQFCISRFLDSKIIRMMIIKIIITTIYYESMKVFTFQAVTSCET